MLFKVLWTTCPISLFIYWKCLELALRSGTGTTVDWNWLWLIVSPSPGTSEFSQAVGTCYGLAGNEIVGIKDPITPLNEHVQVALVTQIMPPFLY